MRNRFGSLGIAVVAAAVLAGCGGSSGNGASNPTAAVKAYLTGVGNGDGKAACGVLTKNLQNVALTSARSQGVKAKSCEDLFSQVKAHLTPTQRSRFLNAKVTHVTQSGDKATVSVAGATDQPTLVKSNGKWLISGGIGF